MTEARIDLHTHTSFSEDRETLLVPYGLTVTLPFHPTLSPVDAYDRARARGMTHVTFTDHDTIEGCLDLVERHPDPVGFVFGEEVTCYHLGQPLHVGVFGLTPEDHAQIHAGAERSDRERRCLRWHLPALLELLDDRGLVYDLKHPVWVREDAGREPGLVAALLGDLLDRFALVEGINGTRHRRLNELGVALARRFRPGRVAFTGGSDSHTDNIGTVYTRTRGESVEELLASLRAGIAEPVGPHGSHWLLDYDFRTVIESNLSRRAGQLVAIADDFSRDLPLVVRDLLSLSMSAGVAYGVVNEFARQRRLAAEVEALFADTLETDHEAVLAPAPAHRAVHRHV